VGETTAVPRLDLEKMEERVAYAGNVPSRRWAGLSIDTLINDRVAAVQEIRRLRALLPDQDEIMALRALCDYTDGVTAHSPIARGAVNRLAAEVEP
jgi:hypothetical protein